MTHEEYLKLINEKYDEALKHPFVQMITMDAGQRQLFKLAFLNGCHAMHDHYTPIIADLELQVNSYGEQENGEST